MKTTKSILHNNLETFVQLVVEAALHGWTIQDQNPPQLLGFMYETIMERDEDVIDPPPKKTQAEILAEARAAKKAKALAEAAAKAAEEAQEASGKSEESPQTSDTEVASEKQEPVEEKKSEE